MINIIYKNRQKHTNWGTRGFNKYTCYRRKMTMTPRSER